MKSGVITRDSTEVSYGPPEDTACDCGEPIQTHEHILTAKIKTIDLPGKFSSRRTMKFEIHKSRRPTADPSAEHRGSAIVSLDLAIECQDAIRSIDFKSAHSISGWT
jgi:hypothetical protein